MSKEKKKKLVVVKKAPVQETSSVTTLSSRNAFIAEFSNTENFSNETLSHIQSYNLNVKCLQSCKQSIEKMFSLGDEAVEEKFPKEYKQYFLTKALIVGIPILLTIGVSILSVKAGGFTEISNSATFSSLFTAFGSGAIVGGAIGAIDYGINRLVNSVDRITAKVIKRMEKNSKKDMTKYRAVSYLEHQFRKANERKALIANQRNAINENISKIMGGDFSCLVAENGKLKKEFKVLPFFERRGLNRVLKEINERNIELDRLQKIIPMQVEKDMKSKVVSTKNVVKTIIPEMNEVKKGKSSTTNQNTTGRR